MPMTGTARFEVTELGLMLVEASEADRRKIAAAHEFLRICEDAPAEVRGAVTLYAGAFTCKPIPSTRSDKE